MALVYLRKGGTFAALACGFAVSTATAWRYVHRTVDLPAARAPDLGTALRRAARGRLLYAVSDGTLVPIGCSTRENTTSTARTCKCRPLSTGGCCGCRDACPAVCTT